MKRSRSVDEFLRDPIGSWVVAGPTCIGFCVNPELCGAVAWGRPTKGETDTSMIAFDAFRHHAFAERFDVVVDGRGIEGVDPDALSSLMHWLASRQAELRARVRVQYGVVAEGQIGMLLSGIFPVLGETHAFRIVRDPKEAFARLGSDERVCDTLEAAVLEARGEPRELRELRAFLRAHLDGTTISKAANALAVSVRSLQRALKQHGTSFSSELRLARFREAHTWLAQTDEKHVAVAARVGLSENALVQLVQDVAGTTPGELRRRARKMQRHRG